MIRVQLLCHPAWNRLVPVGIATFRYLMVCHSVLCQNTGGEKAILTFVKITLVFLSISNGIFGVLGSIGITGHSFEYLRCMGRQEVFRSKVKTQIQQLLPNPTFLLSRYNLADFLAPVGPTGVEFSGPLWNPARILMNFSNFFFLLAVTKSTQKNTLHVSFCRCPFSMDFCSSFERHIASQFWVNSKTDSEPKHDNNHRNKRGRERKTEGEQQNHNKDQSACLDY